MSPQELYALAMEAANHSHSWVEAWGKFSSLDAVELGHGANGVVLQHRECREAVVKLFDMGDGYLAFATYAKANPSPVFPKVYETGSNIKGTIGVCVLEKLDRTAWAASREGDIEIPGSPWRDLATSLRGVWRGDKPRAKAAEYQFWPQLLEMAQFFGDSVGYDLHGANWMMRGQQLVLTDPFCGVYGTSTKELASRVLLHRPFRSELTEQIEMDLGPIRLAPDRGARRAAPVNWGRFDQIIDGLRCGADFRELEMRVLGGMMGNPQNLPKFGIDGARIRMEDHHIRDEIMGVMGRMSGTKREQWGRFAYEHRPWMRHIGASKINCCLPPPMPVFRLADAAPDLKVETLCMSPMAWEMLAGEWHVEMQNRERKGWKVRQFQQASGGV